MESPANESEIEKDLLPLLLPGSTITLAAEIPYLKTMALFKIAAKVCEQDESVQYIDFDLQFSSLLSTLSQDILEGTGFLKLLSVYRIQENELVDTLIKILSGINPRKGGMIVLDSINALQDLLRKSTEEDSTGANRRAAILLTLFHELALRYSKVLLLSNVRRSRPRLSNGKISWERELIGGRMVRFRSDTLLSASKDKEGVCLTVLSTTDNLPARFRNKKIKIQSPQLLKNRVI